MSIVILKQLVHEVVEELREIVIFDERKGAVSPHRSLLVKAIQAKTPLAEEAYAHRLVNELDYHNGDGPG